MLAVAAFDFKYVGRPGADATRASAFNRQRIAIQRNRGAFAVALALTAAHVTRS
jgi:hypothetical protein